MAVPGAGAGPPRPGGGGASGGDYGAMGQTLLPGGAANSGGGGGISFEDFSGAYKQTTISPNPANLKQGHNEKIAQNQAGKFLSRFVGAIHRDGERRKVMNWIPFLWGMTVPWLLFVSILWANSQKFRYPKFVQYVSGVVFVAMLAASWYLSTAAKHGANRFKRQKSDTERKLAMQKNAANVFHAKLAIVGLIYVFIGYIGGDLLFWHYFYPYLELKQMASYVNVNPSSVEKISGLNVNDANATKTVRAVSGKRYMDAGKIYFDSSAKIEVDRSKAMSFKSRDMYCVAPIVDANCKSFCGYDFWAVGVNCCGNDDQVDFTCDLDPKNPTASTQSMSKNGVRWVDNLSKPFFRLAVVEAEGVHKVRSKHPIFVKFLGDGTDPQTAVNTLGQQGMKILFTVGIGSFVLNLGIVALLAYRTG